MRIAILGHGQEGQSIERYFKKSADIQVFDKFNPADLSNFQLSNYDLVFRSPSVHPDPKITAHWTSSTRYFFEHCPAKIIGVTGTKGKGTTCTLISALLKAFGKTVHLVGNIGNPALDTLDKIDKDDIVVFELSSFQLWDLDKSPHIAVILRIEPDHLDIHDNFDDYVAAKTNIVEHQVKSDYCVYFRNNETSANLAQKSLGTKIPYPLDERDEIITGKKPPKDAVYLDGFVATALHPLLYRLFLEKKLRGRHFVENFEAALLAVAALLKITNLSKFIYNHEAEIRSAIQNFTPLPHRLQFVRELNNVEYYDDNYASAFPALDVALGAFSPNYHRLVLIAGGKDRGLDLSETKKRIFKDTPNLAKVILIGETSKQLAAGENPDQYEFADTLDEAVKKARAVAESMPHKTYNNRKFPNIVLMSPGAASFDMFENFEDRGQKYQSIVKELK